MEQSPTTFVHRNLKPDVCLTVFTREFHVNSTILKLHSEFFNKFLDRSANTGFEAASNSTSLDSNGSNHLFKYNWVTKVEDDGGWFLGSKSDTIVPIGDIKNFKGVRSLEEEAFEKLLLAIYNRPFQMTSLDELRTVTNLADYYCALPILNTGLYAVLLQCKDLSDQIFESPESFLELAVKLRNRALFQDALILSLGPFHCPRFRTMSNKTLKAVAEDVYNSVCAQLMNVQGLLFNFLLCNRTQLGNFPNWVTQCSADNSKFSFPQFMKKIGKEMFLYVRDVKEIREAAMTVLNSNLTFHGIRDPTEEQKYAQYFLGVTIEDRHIPWDLEASDW